MKPLWKIPVNWVLLYLMKLEKGRSWPLCMSLRCNGWEHVTDIALYFTTRHNSIWDSSAPTMCWQSDRNVEPMINGLSWLWYQTQHSMWINLLTKANAQQILGTNLKFKTTWSDVNNSMKLFQQVHVNLRISSQWYYYKSCLCNDITNRLNNTSGYLDLFYKTCCIHIPHLFWWLKATCLMKKKLTPVFKTSASFNYDTDRKDGIHTIVLKSRHAVTEHDYAQAASWNNALDIWHKHKRPLLN